MGGPVGAGAGAAAGAFLTDRLYAIGIEVLRRHLSPREERRVGAVVLVAAAAIQEKINSGRRPRDDGFFDPQPPDNRSSAEEIAEGALIAAQREHEEKKILHLGYLLANIAFSPHVTRERANHMVRIAQSLSYRQLCILRVAALSKNLALKKGPYGPGLMSYEQISLLTEIYDMYRSSLIIFGEHALLNLADIDPSQMRLFGIGIQLDEMLELRRLDNADIVQTGKMLQYRDYPRPVDQLISR